MRASEWGGVQNEVGLRVLTGCEEDVRKEWERARAIKRTLGARRAAGYMRRRGWGLNTARAVLTRGARVETRWDEVWGFRLLVVGPSRLLAKPI